MIRPVPVLDRLSALPTGSERLGSLWPYTAHSSDRTCVTFVTVNTNRGCELCSMSVSLKEHWEKVYESKGPDQVSWTQQVPAASLELIRKAGLPASARIIDIGAGDSRLVDYLLEDGFSDITVLDISGNALKKARQRLGSRAEGVRWVESDVLGFRPEGAYDLWHDRAAFHFLSSEDEIVRYAQIVGAAAPAYLVIGTFSDKGPEKCSGLRVHRYDEASLFRVFEKTFEKIRCFTIDHVTPANARQNFLFCLFRHRKIAPAS